MEANLGFPYVHQIKTIVSYKYTLLVLWREMFQVSSSSSKVKNFQWLTDVHF